MPAMASNSLWLLTDATRNIWMLGGIDVARIKQDTFMNAAFNAALKNLTAGQAVSTITHHHC